MQVKISSSLVTLFCVCYSNLAQCQTEIDAVWRSYWEADWNNANKWDIGVVPNNTATEIYNTTLQHDGSGRGVIIFQDDVTVQDAVFASSYWVSADQPMTFTVNGDFIINYTEIAGPIDLVINGYCFTNGDFSGTGVTTISELATMRVEHENGNPSFTRDTINYGHVTIAGNDTDSIHAHTATVFKNYGVVDITTPQQVHWRNTFENDGIVNVGGGGLRCEGDSTGVFNVSEGSELWVTAGDLSQATFSGNGDVFFTFDGIINNYAIEGQTRISGNVDFNAPEELTFNDFEMYGRSLGGNADIRFEGNCHFRGGNYFIGEGHKTIPDDANVTLDSATFRIATQFTNYADWSSDSSWVSKANINSVNDRFVNYGYILMTYHFGFSVSEAINYGQIECVNFSSASDVFQNMGEVNISGVYGTAKRVTSMVNEGLFHLNANTLYLHDFTQTSEGVLSTGTAADLILYASDGFAPLGEMNLLGDTFLREGEMTLSSNLTIRNARDFTVEEAATLILENANFQGNGDLWIIQATLSGSGHIEGDLFLSKPYGFDYDRTKSVQFEIGGEQAIGTITVGGTCDFNITTRDASLYPSPITFEIAGADPQQVDHLNVTGLVKLSGDLRVEFLEDYAPNLGDEFELISSGNMYGKFTSIELPELPGGLIWSYSQSTKSVRLTVKRDYLYEWRVLHGKSTNGDDDNVDSSSNGVDDLFYYAFGLGNIEQSDLPNSSIEPLHGGMPAITQTVDGYKLAITCRSDQYRNSLIMHVLISEDLVKWRSLSGAQWAAMDTQPLNEEYELMTLDHSFLPERFFVQIQLSPVW